MKVYKKIVDVIVKVASVLACVMLAGLVVIIIVELVNRNLFNKSFSATIEICGIAFMWLAYLGIIPLLQSNGLLSLGFVSERAKGWFAHFLFFLAKVAITALGAVLIVSFIAMYPYTNTRFYATIPWLPYSFLFFPTVLAGASMILISVYQMIDYIQTKICKKTTGEVAEA